MPGKILDALVSEGANQINGPNLTIDKPEAALDEARAKAIASGRARAELYARALGMRVVACRVGQRERRRYPAPPPMPMMCERMRAGGRHQDRSRRAEAAGQPGDDVRAAVNAEKAARLMPRGLRFAMIGRD